MEQVTIESRGKNVTVFIKHPRIDGENHIINAIRNSASILKDTEYIEIDFEPVRYINSLGISEIINIHRYLNEISGDKSRLVFRNVDPKVLSVLELIEIHKIAEIIPAGRS